MTGIRLTHKFHAQRDKRDGINFASKKEAAYYSKLKILRQAGEILFFLRQVPFDLPGNTKYVLDFIEFHAPKNNEPGDIIFTEVKGYMTPMAKLKISQTEQLYGIKINVV